MAASDGLGSSAIQPLLSSVASEPPSPEPPPTPAAGHHHTRQPWFRWQHKVFPKSKGAIMILVWNTIVGFVYGTMLSAIVALSAIYRGTLHYTMYIVLGGFAFIALFQLLSYPVGGLLADLCCGRYKIVSLSIFKIWLGILLFSIIGVTYIANNFEEGVGATRSFMIVVMVVAFIVLAAGFTGFQANAVQFGLDQLLDAPSTDLSIFLHWYEWTQNLGEFLARLMTSTFPCNFFIFNKVAPFIPLVSVIATGAILVFSYYKRKWFHCEPRTHNPYGMVYRVLKFVAGHDKPLRPSAFTYCDDEIPTRMEFAKQRFGGPFSTETVEDVKTFLRILVMLLLVTPVFNLHVSSSYIFPLYGIYLGDRSVYTEGCKPIWMLLQSGSCSYMVTIFLLPPYLMFVHPNVSRWMPRILHRLLLGIVLMVITVVIMLGLLIAAKHTALQREGNVNTTCLFLAEVRDGIVNDTSSSRLHYHTLVLIVPSILTGITIPLTYITIMEFISAQSPHTMKGLLLGTFYAFRGLFIMMGCFFVFPFTQPRWWADSNGSVYDCGFSYYLTSTVLGVVGIVTVSIGVKWYHYRDRQDKPYGPSYVEDYYSRYTRHARSTAMVTSAELEEEEEVEEGHLHSEINASILAYGTMDGT